MEKINIKEIARSKKFFDQCYDELMGLPSPSALNDMLIACYQFIDTLSPILFSETGDIERNRLFGTLDKVGD